MKCRRCGFDSTKSDPCLCHWEMMKEHAEQLGRGCAQEWGEDPLSGEWVGGWTPASLAATVGFDPTKYPELLNDLCDAFEKGYFSDQD